MNLTKQAKKVLLLLISANGSATTLEVKNILRLKYPKVKINQSDVSSALIDVYDSQSIKGLKFDDNGSYRIYHINGKTPSTVTGPHIMSVTKTNMAETLYNSNGDIVSLSYVKANGDDRTIMGVINQNDYFNALGYVKFLEHGKSFKLVDPRTIKAITLGNVIYSLK